MKSSISDGKNVYNLIESNCKTILGLKFCDNFSCCCRSSRQMEVECNEAAARVE